MLEKLNYCTICPHKCGVNRNDKIVGRCKSKDTVKIALYSIHNFEEPCISGERGSRNNILLELQYELYLLSKL